MAREYKFESAWVSDRGFANEGAWVYGTANELSDVHAKCEHGVNILRGHNSMNAAKNRCEREVRRDAKSMAWGEQSYVSTMSASEWLGN